MGTLTLGTVDTAGTLMGEVKAALGNRSDTDGRILTALNLSQERIARLYDFTELHKTVSNTLTYTGVAADDMYLDMPDSSPYIREIFSVVLKDSSRSHKLVQVPTRTWDRILGDPSALAGNDRPYFYTVWDYQSAQAEIYPLPTQSFSVQWRLSQWPTPLSSPSGTSDFRFKDEIIIEGAVVYLMFSLGMEEDAKKHVAKMALFLQESIKADPRQPDIDVQPHTSGASSGNLQGAYWLNPFVHDIEDAFR